MLRILAAAALILSGHALPVLAQQGAAPSQPPRNVLWIFVEDMNDWLGCYGDDLANTPNLDALAARGTRFTRAYMPAGVCSPTRSAVITSCWQTSIGAHNHRSGRQRDSGHRIRLPDGVRPIPAVLRDAGYYTFNFGKTDYNFEHDPKRLYDWHKANMNFDRIGAVGKLWRPAVRAGKPFFGQIQLRGGKNRAPARVEPATVRVPPYYPDIASVRREIAHHYDVIEKTDREVGKILTALRNDRLHERTVVMFFSDHGYRMHRHKQFVYDGSVRVPCIMAGPGISQTVRSDLISGIDLGATTLALAKATPPAATMHGRDVFAVGFRREFVVSARDRCDFTIDRIRAVTTPRFRYLRNYLTDRPYMQPQYRDGMAITKELRALARDGRLNATQMQFYGAERPAEELYDLSADPHEVRNLARSAEHADDLAHHRQLLAQWIERTGDQGQQPESIASLREVLERWGARCVNPEYDAARAAIAAEQAGKPRILILGDSISMGYTPVVQQLLRGEAKVVRPKENCAGTSKGVAKIDAWLQIDGGDFDLIWFNAGLHDLKRVKPNGKNSNDPADRRQAEPDVYDRQLRAIVRKLVATGAKLVFATTTPVPKGGVRPHRDVADAQRYNGIARRIMAEHGIEVCDLYAFALRHQPEIQPRVDVHFTRQGSAMLGAQVAEAMRRQLEPVPR